MIETSNSKCGLRHRRGRNYLSPTIFMAEVSKPGRAVRLTDSDAMNNCRRDDVK